MPGRWGKPRYATFVILAGTLLPLLLLLSPARAQQRTAAAPPRGRPAAAPVAGDDLGLGAIKVDVSLVSFPATVTDPQGRFIPSLRRQDFTLLEDGRQQAISVFHDEVAPVSVGIVIDTSGSMDNKLDQAVDALEHFVRTIQPDDDVFLMRFAGDVALELDSTGNRELFSRAARRLEARGATRLYDALAEALEKVARGRHQKKALLLITDGNDTSSLVAFDQVLEHARQSEVLVYCMGIAPDYRASRQPRVVWNRRGRVIVRGGGGSGARDRVDMGVLEAIADATGGRAFYVENAHAGGRDAIDASAQLVSAELRHQYTIGYYPTNAARDGAFRKIRLVANVPGVDVRHRRGYYAPKE